MRHRWDVKPSIWHSVDRGQERDPLCNRSQRTYFSDDKLSTFLGLYTEYKTASNFAQDKIGSASVRRRTWPTGLLHLPGRNCYLGQGEMPNTAFVMSPRSCLLERIIPTGFRSHLVLLVSTLCLSCPLSACTGCSGRSPAWTVSSSTGNFEITDRCPEANAAQPLYCLGELPVIPAERTKDSPWLYEMTK